MGFGVIFLLKYIAATWTLLGSGAALTDRGAAERRFMFVGQLQTGYPGAGYAYRGNETKSKVDPANATYDEMMLLVKDFMERGEVEEGAFDFIQKPDDLSRRFDYLAEARAWKKAQRDSGEMVGYHKVLQACNAMCNFIFGPAYIETEHGMQPVKYMEGELTSGILGLGGCPNGSYYAVYAADSTAEHPIVEVRVAHEDGTGEKIYYVDINSVNPANATELEMFALLAHYEKQGAAGRTRLYYQGFVEGIFHAQTVAEFMFESRNWLERLEQFADSEIAGILTELFHKIEESRAEEGTEQEPLPEDTLNMLAAESISCTYPSDDPGKEDDLYLIVCDAQGIRCLKAGEPGFVWEITFTDASQYQKAVDFMHGICEDDDRSFLCLEDFWQDFLAG